MENQLLFRQRKKVHSGFGVKNLVVDLFVQRMKAMPFKELSKRGGTQISNSRFAIYTVDLRNFVLSKTYRKKAMEDLILRVQTAKIHVPSDMWADENQIEKPNCYHGQQTVMKRVKKDGPNKGRLFFCCANENSCQYFQWAPKEKSTKPSSRDVEDSFSPNFYNRLY